MSIGGWFAITVIAVVAILVVSYAALSLIVVWVECSGGWY